jgi:hypothetical protein
VLLAGNRVWQRPGAAPRAQEERLAAAAAPRAPPNTRAPGGRGGEARAALKAEAAAIAAAAFAEGGVPSLAGLSPVAVEDLRRLQARACPDPRRARRSGSSPRRQGLRTDRPWPQGTCAASHGALARLSRGQPGLHGCRPRLSSTRTCSGALGAGHLSGDKRLHANAPG